MGANPNVSLSQLTGDHADALMRLRVFGDEKIFGKVFAKTAMSFNHSVRRHGPPFEPAFIDPSLYGDMSPSLHLEVALPRIPAIVFLQGE